MTDFARLQLDADTRGLKRGERDLKDFSRQANSTARTVDRSSNDMAGAFKKIGAAAASAGVALILADFGRASVQAAIDAEEMDAAFGVVFGNMADDVRAWAEETGNALGRSTQEIQRGALAFQELFGKALDPEQAAELSKQFAVLTQDLASFKNLSNEVAQQKLFSGLVGEAEPLRAVGVFLSEAAVEAKALELGIGGVNGALTDQDKIVVRAAIINEQLADAQGDVLRTSDSAANQIKAMNAAVEELQVAIGQELLPQLTPLITLTAEFVTVLADAAQQISLSKTEMAEFTEGLRVAGTWIRDASGAVGEFASGLGVTVERVEYLTERVNLIINPLDRAVKLLRLVGRLYGGTAESAEEAADQTGNFAGRYLEFTASAQTTLPVLKSTEKAIEGVVKRTAAANDNVKELTTGFERLQVVASQSGLLGGLNPLSGLTQGFNATLQEGSFGLFDASFGNPNASFDATLREMADTAETQTVAVARSFADMARDVTFSMQQLSNGIRNGGVLDILGGLIGLFGSLGSTGLFGQSIADNLNRPRSFDGGGYTGSGARSGGLDGKGGFLAMLHPQETVFDHTRTPANDVSVRIGFDQSAENIVAMVDGRVAASMPLAASAGSALAQGEIAQRAARRIR